MSLRLLHVTKRYGSQLALDDVSLHVHDGDCYGFLGHNGAGKTTALRIALGLVRPDAGSVRVAGFDAHRHRAEANALLGGLIETPGFHGSLSARRNLGLLAGLHGLPRATGRREADRLLEMVGLSSVGDKPVGAYSQGMRQRLGIAQALLGDPRYVLLDEPTNGLDPEGIEEMRRLLRRLTRDEGRTVVISSHQLHELAGLCTRIAILREGRLLVEDATETLLAGGTTGLRHRLDCGDAAAATRVLTGLGVASVESDAGDGPAVRFDPGDVPPERIAAAVVQSGLPLRALSPEPPTLEEIYLRFTRFGGETSAAPSAVTDDERPPVARVGGLRSTLRVARHEVARWTSSASVPVLLLLPALLGAAGVVRLWAKQAGHLAEVADGELFSQTSVTAFEAVGEGLAWGLPLLGFVLAGLASQSIAAAAARGTLRNVALRPLGRGALGLGKALAVCGAAVLGYLLLVGCVLAPAAGLFEFGDVQEILEIRTAKPFVFVTAEELAGPLRRTLALAGVPLVGCVALGFLAGALLRNGTRALALAAGGLVTLDLLRVAGRIGGWEDLLLTTYLRTPLGERSVVDALLFAIRSPNQDASAFAPHALAVPLVWALALFVPALFVLRRREIR